MSYGRSLRATIFDMGERHAQQVRRERQQVKRQQASREVEARETQRKQAEAAARKNYIERQRRHIAAGLLWGIALVVALTHFFEHMGWFHVMASGLEDLFIGWPMAGLLALAGAIVWGRD